LKYNYEISKKFERELEKRMMFDKLLEESELTEKDVNEIDHKVKRGIIERAGWSN